MADWLERTVLPSALAGAVLLLVLWPTSRSGQRLLRTWGIPTPAPDQVAAAVRYLRQRRILYVVMFLVVPPLAGLVIRTDTAGMNIYAPLLLAMLVAELVATLRPVSGVRVARLDRREWRDLVPRWAVRTMAVMAVLTAGLATYGLTRERPLSASQPHSLATLGYLVVGLTMVGLLVQLAVRRPAVADEAVDGALRTRTARVAFGIGFGWVGAALAAAGQRVYSLHVVGVESPERNLFVDVLQFSGVAALVVSVGCWLWVALPSHRSRARTG